MSAAAATGVLGGSLLSGGVVSAAAATGVLSGSLLSGLMATAAAPAAAVRGRDGVGVDQLEHLTISHVFSLSFGPTGHFSEPYPV